MGIDRGEQGKGLVADPMGSDACRRIRRHPDNGARGYYKDTVLEWIYRYARQARLVDGADEVHRMLLCQELAAEGSDFWRWPVAVV
jgi:alkylation response protein AidB-like acyl-CoA dehydrogenase